MTYALFSALAESPIVAFVIWSLWHEPRLPPSARAELERLRNPGRPARRVWGVLVVFGRRR